LKNKNDFTAEDLIVAAPEVCSLRRPAVDLISVSSQNKPAYKKDEGDNTIILVITYHFYNKAHLYIRPPLEYTILSQKCHAVLCNVLLMGNGHCVHQ